MKTNKFYNILVTGGAGFIGINFIKYLLDLNYKNIKIINIDKFTEISNKKINSIFDIYKNYKFYKIDINNKKKIKQLFKIEPINTVINFAAETHVDNSIINSEKFIQSNFVGTYNLLNAAYNKWMKKPFIYKKNYQNSLFIQVSTDEVYGSIKKKKFAKESDKFYPSSPYSATKASAEHIVNSFYKTFGLNTIITNCTNNYGPFQNKEKLIPKIIWSAINRKKINIYGNGKNIRDWLYVDDHCDAIFKIMNNGIVGQNYNISTNEEKNNIFIAKNICKILDNKYSKNNGSYLDQIMFVKDRPGHDFRYGIDSSKLRKLGWRPKTNFIEGLEKTIEWNIKKIIFKN